jgi:hypothetical protein
MLPQFTELLRDYLLRRGVASARRVTLGPPDRAFVTRLPPGTSVNVYLADIRENRRLRTNDRVRQPIPDNNTVREDPLPAWVDAHYLITAWNKAQDASDAALKEQETLRAVSAALLAGDPFTPNTVYAAPDPGQGPALVAAFGAANLFSLLTRFAARLDRWLPEFRAPGLMYQVLPPEGFPKLSEFWTTMGQGSVWKPVVYLVASVPVELDRGAEQDVVTTLTTRTGQTEEASGQSLVLGTEHAWLQVGGLVLRFDGARPLRPVRGARVLLFAPSTPPRTPTPIQDATTGADGRYQFTFAAPAHAGPVDPFAAPFRVVAAYPGLEGDPLDVDLNPTTPFAHDLVLRPVV